ncbi:MAG: hypothetical protein HS099_16860 [Ardenticatenaceae bacterium]|nr:hypothetical protein [Ardenticatenaceae bacterium]
MTGRQARHLNTLAGMVSGIVRSGQCQMKAMGKKAPDKSKVESRSKRFTRYVQNEQVDAQTYYLPFIVPLLVGLARCGLWCWSWTAAKWDGDAWHWSSVWCTRNGPCR